MSFEEEDADVPNTRSAAALPVEVARLCGDVRDGQLAKLLEQVSELTRRKQTLESILVTKMRSPPCRHRLEVCRTNELITASCLACHEMKRCSACSSRRRRQHSSFCRALVLCSLLVGQHSDLHAQLRIQQVLSRQLQHALDRGILRHSQVKSLSV